MASHGERVPGVVGMCSSNLESMARDGTTSCNFNKRGSSPSYSEHGLCRQTESHNGGTARIVAPRRGTEQAAILSAANGTTRGECSQQPSLQTTWAWQAKQADINGLRKQLTEEWETKLEEQKWKHNLEVKQLEHEVGRGNRDRKQQAWHGKGGQARHGMTTPL